MKIPVIFSKAFRHSAWMQFIVTNKNKLYNMKGYLKDKYR